MTTARLQAAEAREAALDAAAQEYVDALAERDAMTPEDAARAAGARTAEQVEQLAARIRADRQPLRSTA